MSEEKKELCSEELNEVAGGRPVDPESVLLHEQTDWL